MPREFKYDMIKLLNCVRDHPCLWDKTLENYKDRFERKVAWEEIFCTLDDTYPQMSDGEKKLTAECIQTKWANVRDTFVRTLKSKFGKPKRKYIFHDHLTFLIKYMPEEESPIEFSEDNTIMELKQEEDFEAETETFTSNSNKRPRNTDEDYDLPNRSAAKSFDGYKETEFYGVPEPSDSRIMNEDEAFFASLLPTVVKYSEDERLEFRIEVLAVMKKIKDKRNWSSDR